MATGRTPVTLRMAYAHLSVRIKGAWAENRFFTEVCSSRDIYPSGFWRRRSSAVLTRITAGDPPSPDGFGVAGGRLHPPFNALSGLGNTPLVPLPDIRRDASAHLIAPLVATLTRLHFIAPLSRSIYALDYRGGPHAATHFREEPRNAAYTNTSC